MHASVRTDAAPRPLARRPGSLDVELLDSWDELGEEWDTLAEASGNVFATREWIACWWRHFGVGRRARTLAVRDRDGALIGVVPLYLWMRRPLRVLRIAGHRGAGFVSPAAHPRDAEAVGAAIRSALPRLGADVLLADGLPTRPDWAGRLGARVVNAIPSPTLALRGSWEEQRRGFSRNLRQELSRKERRLEREYDVAYRLVTSPDEAGAAFDTFVALHLSRWQDGGSTFADEGFRAFQRSFADAAARAGWLRIWLLELNGSAAAAWYGFRFAGAETYYQAGRAALAETSIGTILLGRTIRAAVEDGLSEYRFGPGGGEYKYRFADRRDVLQVATVERGVTARAAVGLLAGARRSGALREVIRHVVRRP